MIETVPDEHPGTTYVLAPDTEARRRRDALWLEAARGLDDPPLPEERPDLTVGLTVDRSTVPFTATYAAAFGLIRGLYIRNGTGGLDAFFRTNDMVAPTGTRNYEPSPEEFLSKDLRIVYRLLVAARGRVERIARERVRQLEPVAAADALARLERSHTQIEREVRYLKGPGIEAGSALDERVSASLYSLGDGSIVVGLLAELGRCRALVTQLDAAGDALRVAHGNAMAAAIRKLGPLAFMSPARAGGVGVVVPNALASAAVNRAVEADPAVRERREAFDALEAELEGLLAVVGQEYPVLFRIYRDADPANLAGVASTVVAALRRAHTANHVLRRDLSGDASDVWQFPPSVRETLMDIGIQDASIAWTAAEERLEREHGPRLAAQLGVVSGLAAGGAALLGAAIVAPPVAVVIAIADVVVNAIDALQEYLAYRQLRAGFDAVLDPSLALGTEPGLLGTVLTIAFDLASVVPIPGGRGATRTLAP
jgi:hypothetical protein